MCSHLDCSDDWNQRCECLFGGEFVAYCCGGEYVRTVPCEYYCCCCSTKASCCDNSCGLCGLKSGEPKLLFPFLTCLEVGEAVRTSEAFNTSRQQWSARTGIA